MPIELPNSEMLDHYRQLMEKETLTELSINGYAKTPRDQEILLYGFREGFNKAKNYILSLVKIY